MKDLISLIKAAGSSGIAGQSFLANVPGAAAAVAMIDYLVTAWAITGKPAVGTTYPSGTTFTEAITFTRGAKASLIQQGAAGLTVMASFMPPGGSVTIGTASIDVSAGTGSVPITVVAPYDATAFSVAPAAWYHGYTSPSAPSSSTVCDLDFKAGFAAGVPSGTVTVSFDLDYNPDTAGFNVPLSDTQSATVSKRALVVGDLTFEWHSTSAYSDASPGTGETFTYRNSPGGGAVITFYLRYRVGTGAWTNYGAVSMTDNSAHGSMYQA